jgi:hypothetical protein
LQEFMISRGRGSPTTESAYGEEEQGDGGRWDGGDAEDQRPRAANRQVPDADDVILADDGQLPAVVGEGDPGFETASE